MRNLVSPLVLLLLLSARVAAAPVCINEFLADNTATSFQDEDQDTPDWIELHNANGASLNLGGYYLTDDFRDLTKWQIPAVSLPGNAYLVVFASAKDRAPTNGDPLHTNFVLSQTGEYLALVAPDGTTVVSEFGPNGTDYPNQHSGVSYGLHGAPASIGYMLNPTPGEANDSSSAVAGFVDDTEFDVDRGFYDQPFQVTITSNTPDALIRYTTDGSWPTERSGTRYTGPVEVSRTLPLKAIAYKAGYVPSNVDTQTYIFVDDVLGQTASNTQSIWGLPSSWNGQTVYYGMDGNPSVSPLTHPTLANDLKLVPTLSISMETDDLFGSSGIYSHPQSSGVTWERRTSLEFIDPADPEGGNDFQQNCAIRIQGGAFRGFGLTRKKSFRLLFKSDYGTQDLPTGGPGKLSYPLFGPDAVDEFQTVILRMESNDGWQWGGAGGQPQYARDEFGRRAQLALGQPAPHGRYCHVYLNGVYWGVYNLVERPDAGFAESYFGADRDLWQGQNSGSPINSATETRDWNTMLSQVDDISAAASDIQRDREYLQACGYRAATQPLGSLPVWIDPVNFADYLIVNWYGGNSDWPFKNYYCGRAREDSSTGFKFFMWDSEWSLLLRSNVNTDRTTTFSGVAAPQQHLARSPEYQVLFGDRAHRALFNDGPFTTSNARRLYTDVTRLHLRILNAEAARWGNQHGGAYSVTHWRREQRNILNQWFTDRPAIFLNQLRARGLYPNIAAPTYSQHGGSVSAVSGPTMSVPDDVTQIYYMFGPGDANPNDYGHSLDPRMFGGGINPNAELIEFGPRGDGTGTFTSDPLGLTEPGFLLSRSYNSSTGEWSALNMALFTVDTVRASANNTVISEVHYHPAMATQSEIDAGFSDQDEFEFIEVQNIGEQTIDMTEVDFANGIEFEFPPGYTIAAGEHAVIVKNLAAFNLRYPGVPPEKIAGTFMNNSGLRNSGETILLRTATGGTIKSFRYEDQLPWPTDADGVTGVSLVLINPFGNPDHSLPHNWRASASQGTPGAHDDVLKFVGDPSADEDHDGVAALLEHGLGTSDTVPGEAGSRITFGTREIAVEDTLADYFTLSYVREQRAEDVEVSPQVSLNLVDWDAGPVTMILVSVEPLSGTTSARYTWRSSVPDGEHAQLFVRLRAESR